jgi:arylsulfatase A-like enzyme
MAGVAGAGYLADPTFVFGSVFGAAHPLVLLAVTGGSAAAFFVWSRHLPASAWRGPLVGGLLVLAMVWLWPTDRSLASWRQSHVTIHQLSRLVDSRSTAMPEASLFRAAAADLDGELRVDPLSPGSNVLLVILEGVSGAYLPTLAATHGFESRITMPELDAVAASGLAWSSFVVHQRQTNRGEYALLCGDYPKLRNSEPKMTELAGATALDCLPSVLADAGYTAFYLQAAPMAFMLKDQFMPAAGFHRSLGDASLDRAYHRNEWGIDDRAFFEHSLDVVDELEAGESPWFLTLLTVGTHHPFNAPPDFESRYETGSAGWAMDYLDRAVGEFVRGLEGRGVLDDTLVVIVSDESRETLPGAGDVVNSLLQAWGVAIVLHPDRSRGVVDEPGMQLDVPITVVDALGLGSSGFGGRSLLRRYQSPRDLLWGNVHLEILGGLSADGQLAICAENFAVCAAAAGVESPFEPGVELRPADPEAVGWLAHGVDRSLATSRHVAAERSLPLLDSGSVRLVSDTGQQFIFGGQLLSMAAGSRADIDLVVTLQGPGGGLTYHHDFIVGRRQEYVRSGRLEVGQTLTLRYSVRAGFPLHQLESRMWVDGIDGSNLTLDFVEASLRVIPGAAGSAGGGIEERQLLVE